MKLRKSDATQDLDRGKALKAASSTPPTPEKVESFDGELRKWIMEGPVPLRKACIRAFLDQISIHERDRHHWSQGRLGQCAAAKGNLNPLAGVPAFVPEWCARQDSNL